MKRLKRIYLNMLLRYLLLLAVAIVGIFVAFTYMQEKSNQLLTKNAQFIIDYGNNAILFDKEAMTLTYDRTRIESTRVEVLEDYKVIYSEGPRLGGEVAYLPEEINAMIQSHYIFMDEKAYMPEYIPFTGVDGKAYGLLIKKDKNDPKNSSAYGVGALLPEYLKGTILESEIIKILRNALIGAILFLLLLAIGFGQLTSFKFTRPLKELKQGLKKADAGDLNTRLVFEADEEFEEVRDAFNHMMDRLYKAQQENIRLQESKKRFILDLSHDLKTPITTIQGYAYAISTGVVEDEEKKSKYLRYIYNKSETMTKLINKLFEYSKLENTNYQLDKAEVDIGNCFRCVIIDHLDYLDEKAFVVNIDIPEQVTLYNCDSIEMERAISNIIANQIKYNPEGTTVTYRLSIDDTSLRLIFIDDGIGIEQEVQERIFDAMVRGDESRHGMDGTGLGLAITKKVIQLHHGDIKVDSHLGRGTTFEMTLPL